MPTEIINPDPFCDVRLTNIKNQGRATDKFMIEVQKPESEEFVELPGVGTVHSADYKLVTNKQVNDMAQQVMSETGMEFRPINSFGNGHSEPRYWNGRRFSSKWFTKDVTFDMPGTSSAMAMGVEVTNSYDGSCKVGLAFFALHLICSNQFYTHNMLGRPFEFQHVNRGGNLEDDISTAMEQIKTKASTFGSLAPVMKGLMDTHVKGFDGFLKLRQELTADTGCQFRDKQLLDELSGRGVTQDLGIELQYKNPSSYWDIANAYTAVTTHAVGGPRGSDQSARVVDWLIGHRTAAA
jgi:hypothetical protein